MRFRQRYLRLIFLLSEWNFSRPPDFAVDAKLHLWSSSSLKDDDEQFVSPNNKKARRNESIHDRLERHRGETSIAAKTYDEYHRRGVISPVTYLNIVVVYLRNSVRSMTEHLYPSARRREPTSSAYELFQYARWGDVAMSEPKDAWEGFLSAIVALRTGYLGGVSSIVDGAYELGCGTIAAFVSLIGGGRSDAIDPLSYIFLSELFHGFRRGAAHAADGVYTLAAGAVVGTRNFMVGIYRTPEAVRASKKGMTYYPWGKPSSTTNHQQENKGSEAVAVWDYYSLDDEDADLAIEEKRWKEQNADYPTRNERKREKRRNVRRRRTNASVKNKRYYDVLGVATDADSKEIRSAYRKEALKHHPDKQTASSPSTNDNTPLEDPRIEGFLDLTEAYRTLSDDASRDAYDRHGLCFREETSLAEEGTREDYVDLIEELFSASVVRDYVGDVLIAPIINEMFGFAENWDTARESVEVQNMQQKRRTVEIAKYLRDRVNPYIQGEDTIEDFGHSCRKEAEFMLQEGGEPTKAFLRVIGRAMLEEADERIGYVLPFVRKKISLSRQKARSSIANVRVYAPIYLRAALEQVVPGARNGRENEDGGDCSGSRKSNKENVDQGAVLDLLWQYVVNDAVATLREACEKVFDDQGAMDARLAFVKTPSFMKHQTAKRAEAVRILAREMLAASAEVSEVVDER